MSPFLCGIAKGGSGDFAAKTDGMVDGRWPMAKARIKILHLVFSIGHFPLALPSFNFIGRKSSNLGPSNAAGGGVNDQFGDKREEEPHQQPRGGHGVILEFAAEMQQFPHHIEN